MLGIPLRYDISIPNLVLLLLDLADKHKWNVYILGAIDEVNTNAINNIKKKYKSIGLVCGRNGYIKEKEEIEIISEINTMNINILLIGMPSPQKERIAHEWKDRLDVNIIVPCGGMIDVLSGATSITPPFIKKVGLAAIYRLIQEPRRLFKSRLAFFVFFLFLSSFPFIFGLE